MRALFAAALLLSAAWAQAGDAPAPTIRSALEAADAATAGDIPPIAMLDEREAALHELEYRSGKIQSARRQMQQALDDMAADPRAGPKLHQVACQAAVPAMRAPDLFKLLRRKLDFLDRPANYQQLTPSQVERFEKLKISITVLQAQPDITCGKA